MRISELRSAVFNIVTEYFAGATVVWESTEKVKPKGSLVTLRLGALQFSRDEIDLVDDETGDFYSEVPSSVRLTVQLFTHGKKVAVDGTTGYAENTAMEDMMDFVKYMKSPYVVQTCNKHDIAIVTEGGVQDATAVLDPNFEYRSYQEFIVSFQQEMQGEAGISRTDWAQTPSGGGTEELAEQSISDIDSDGIDIEKNFT